MLTRLSAALVRLVPPIQAAKTQIHPQEPKEEFRRFQSDQNPAEDSEAQQQDPETPHPEPEMEPETPQAAPLQTSPSGSNQGHSEGMNSLSPFQIRALRLTQTLVSMIQSLRAPKAEAKQVKANYEKSKKSPHHSSRAAKGSIIDRKAG